MTEEQFNDIPNLFSDEEQASLEAQFAYDPVKAEAVSREMEHEYFRIHIAFFFQALAMYVSQKVIPFEITKLEDKVNYLIADNVYQRWAEGNQEVVALWQDEGENQ